MTDRTMTSLCNMYYYTKLLVIYSYKVKLILLGSMASYRYALFLGHAILLVYTLCPDGIHSLILLLEFLY